MGRDKYDLIPADAAEVLHKALPALPVHGGGGLVEKRMLRPVDRLAKDPEEYAVYKNGPNHCRTKPGLHTENHYEGDDKGQKPSLEMFQIRHIKKTICFI